MVAENRLGVFSCGGLPSVDVGCCLALVSGRIALVSGYLTLVSPTSLVGLASFVAPVGYPGCG